MTVILGLRAGASPVGGHQRFDARPLWCQAPHSGSGGKPSGTQGKATQILHQGEPMGLTISFKSRVGARRALIPTPATVPTPSTFPHPLDPRPSRPAACSKPDPDPDPDRPMAQVASCTRTWSGS